MVYLHKIAYQMFKNLLKRFRKRAKPNVDVDVEKHETGPAEPFPKPDPSPSDLPMTGLADPKIPSNSPAIVSYDARKSIPLMKSPKLEAIDNLIARLPCKAADIPTQSVRDALREFEDAHVTNSQRRKETALCRLLRCLPLESKILNEEVKTALEEMHSAFPEGTTTIQKRSTKIQPPPSKACNNSNDLQQPPQLQSNRRKTLKSVVAVMDHTVDVVNIVDYFKTKLGENLVSFNKIEKRNKKTILYINCTSIEIASTIVGKWNVSGCVVNFRLQPNKSS